ncbi:phage baseplate assembly protein V [Variovorax sp. PAMC26660]|uniref:phage baseplate assembly protein V n=1 Tax=Variovorax sp. PAMC26660 TaxID=2762322 RepID=UPI00164CE9E2|nr:phage baseplate assembly protein V [Variovorax sp. PAMC26660]QNK65766.1 phage baseplate assembly protein [Variovorax sp. PAMC26660]
MNEEIKKLWRRVQLVVSRGRITTTDDSGAVQKVQIQIGELETRDTTPRVAEYGFTSNPLPGCHGVVIFVGGDRSNGVIIGTNDQTARLKNLKPGEVAIYDDQGQSIWLKRTGIEVDGAGLPMLFHNTPSITFKVGNFVRFETPRVETTQLLQSMQLTTGGVSGGVGLPIAAMTNGTINFNNVASNYQSCTTTYVGSTITSDGHIIDHRETHSGVQTGPNNTGQSV